MSLEKLSAAFYRRDAVTVARELLGKRLVRVLDGEPLVVEITETEAYAGVGDRACHAYGGRRTARTAVLYRPGGCAYIYLIYGMYDMFNVVAGDAEEPCAVLVRGGRVVEGRDRIARLRTGKNWAELSPRQQLRLLDGPGKFCKGLALTRAENGLDLLGDTLYFTPGRTEPSPIATGKRIGIDYAGEDAHRPYRFWIP